MASQSSPASTSTSTSTPTSLSTSTPDWDAFLRQQAQSLGFSQIGVTGVDLTTAEPGLQAWLDAGFHGDMAYMAAHGLKRARPAELIPGTVSVITVRMDYLPRATAPNWQAQEWSRLDRPAEAIISVYARGRDYHKVLRARLQKLADALRAHLQTDDPANDLFCRVFTDSAPVLEAELAQRSGQGWRGKHTLVLNRHAGSMFFLGEIYVNAALPHSPYAGRSGSEGQSDADGNSSAPATGADGSCGRCQVCLTVCPTQAIVAPYQLDARRCISYLTIEHAGPIPLEFRRLIGNRIYGCDDCQLACPWNKFAKRSALPDFDERAGLSGQSLVHLFAWTEAEFLRYTEGSPIRRIGHERWQRNLAVAMGNALRHADDAQIRAALEGAMGGASALVREHIEWALMRQSASL